MGQKSADLAREVAAEVQSLIVDLQAIIYRANEALDYLEGFTSTNNTSNVFVASPQGYVNVNY
jgi:hypothetical protein